MKKTITLLFLIIATASLKAQNYQILFAGLGASTTVDSVLVENITQGTSLKLLGVDTLLLQGTTSLNDIDIDKGDIMIYPNPMQEDAYISFNAKKAGNVKISIYDISGKLVLEHSDVLQQGLIKYKIGGLNQGVYFVGINGDNYKYKSRLISFNKGTNTANIEKISNSIANLQQKIPVKLMLSMSYATGDMMRYTGYSGSFSAIVTDIPTSSQTVTFIFIGFNCGLNTVTFTYNGSTVNYGTVIGQNSTCWLDRNLGAVQVATAYNHSDAYGDLFQWGRLDDGHQTRTSGTTYTLSGNDFPGHSNFILAPNSPYDWRDPQNAALWQGASGVNNPCPAGWRLPTETEMNNERTSWGQNNYSGAIASPLKLPSAGYRNTGNGIIYDVGTHGYYWSSTISATGASNLFFGSISANLSISFRADAMSVRCIMD